MSRHHRHRLRLTCESALRLAEWRLADERRRAAMEPSRKAPARARTGPSSFDVWFLWIAVTVMVMVAIGISLVWADKHILVDLGCLVGVVAAFVAAAAIVVVTLALTSRRSQTRWGGP